MRVGDREFLRPIQKLVPLEVTSNRAFSSALMDNQEDHIEDEEDQVKHPSSTRTRTRTIDAPQRCGFTS